MAIWLTVSDDGTASVSLSKDDDGAGRAACNVPGCGWASDPDRFDPFEDVAEEAAIHLDSNHS